MPVTPAEKFKEEAAKMVRYWAIEFELEHWTMAGVMMDVAMDILYRDATVTVDEDEDDEDEDDEEEDDE